MVCPECSAPPGDLMAQEEPAVYDGVLWWHCMSCGHAWHYWHAEPSALRRALVADTCVRAFLAGVEVGRA